MSTPALPPANPPDYISIPEHLKSQPVQVPKPELIGGLRIAAYLGCLLQSAGIHVLGDLDGKRLSDFGCGHGTLWALREMIIRAVYPGAVPDRKTRPVPMRYWWPPESPLEVAPAACGLRLKDVPLSSRLTGALSSLRIENLGQLNGLRFDDLCRCRNFGAKTLAELGTLLLRAEAGEFAVSDEDLAARTPGDLLRQIDSLATRCLPAKQRALIARYFGAAGQPPETLRQIGQQHRVAGYSVGHCLSRAAVLMRRQGGVWLRSLLANVDGICASSHTELSPALVFSWQDPARPFRYSPQFYVRLIAKLRPDEEIASPSRNVPPESDAHGS